MRIGTKIGAAICGVTATLLIAVAIVQHLTISDSFASLEKKQAEDDVARANFALDAETEHLARLCRDWAFWDDTCAFLTGKPTNFEAANLANASWFVENSILAMSFVGIDGKVVWQQVLDPTTKEKTDLAFLPTGRWPEDHVLLQVGDSAESNVTGIVMTERGPWIMSSQPVLTSNFEGPRRGVLVFGRPIDADLVASLRDRTRLSFDFETTGAQATGLTGRPTAHESADGCCAAIDAADPSTLEVVCDLADVFDRPIGKIRLHSPRVVTAHGQRAYRFALFSMSLVALVTIGILLVLLRRIVVRPLGEITEHAARVGATRDLLRRIDSHRDDEFGVLGREFDRMLDELRASRAEAVDLSRKAGMAEVAIGVLHNIGNVLQSVVVSGDEVAKRVGELKPENLRRAATMIDDRRADLANFLTNDPKGGRVVEFFKNFAAHFDAERSGILDEMSSLTTGIRHIQEIVAMHHGYAKGGSNILEMVRPGELMEESLRINRQALERHQIVIFSEIEDLAAASLDRHKILQILGNLLTNAKASLQEVPLDARRLTAIVARVETDDGDMVRFTIKDNGRGIAPENLERIFAFGFTTKAEGHGIGLHMSANAATEMGGSLRAQSDGPGAGAAFVLELPYAVEPEVIACR